MSDAPTPRATDLLLAASPATLAAPPAPSTTVPKRGSSSPDRGPDEPAESRGGKRRAMAEEPGTEARETETTLERILAISAALFATYGYHGTGMAQLVEATGLGRGGLYHHIGSKESVLYEISASIHKRMNAAATRIVESDEPAERKLYRLAHDLLNHLATHSAEWTVAVRESYVLSEERWKAIRHERDLYEEAWQTVLRQGVREGVFRPVEPVIVKGILGLFNNAWQWYQPGRSMTPDDLADEYLRILLEGLRPSSEVPPAPGRAPRSSRRAPDRTA